MRNTLKTGQQLTDEHVDLAQQLLKKQFPHIDGLQTTLLVQNDGFVPVQHESIQIHHIPGHWVTSSSLGLEVAVYDSKFGGMGLSPLLTPQLASLYKLKIGNDEDGDESDPATLTVEVPYVQQQEGYTDCGLFAIAFAVHLALGDEVTALNFEQSLMRQHLLKCFDKKAMVAFPLKKKTAGISCPHRLRLRVIEHR